MHLGQGYNATFIVSGSLSDMLIIQISQSGSSFKGFGDVIGADNCLLPSGENKEGLTGTIDGEKIQFTLPNEYSFKGVAIGNQLQGTLITTTGPCNGRFVVFERSL